MASESFILILAERSEYNSSMATEGQYCTKKRNLPVFLQTKQESIWIGIFTQSNPISALLKLFETQMIHKNNPYCRSLSSQLIIARGKKMQKTMNSYFLQLCAHILVMTDY